MDFHARRRDGFTLVEMVTTLAIAAILLLAAVPAMGSLLARTRDADSEATIAETLRQARTAAVLHNVRTVVCPSRDGRHCRSGDDWQHGWIVVADADHDGQADPGTQALAVVAPMASGSRMITSRGRGHITFQPTGSAGGSNARFTICHARERDGRSIVVANSGRVRIAAPEPERLRECLAGISSP